MEPQECTAEFPVVILVNFAFISVLSMILIKFTAVKLSYVMSLYYELNNRNAQSCDFSGNATVNPLASKSSSAADLAATSCVASPSATFTPTDIAAAATGSSTSSSSSSSSSNTGSSKNNGAVSMIGEQNVVIGVGVMTIVGLISAVWTLA